ncbi:hypothetical protein [Saccharothrix luteola]|uniref:hypothetical protein n=1 Tax=Saccharothrix luteola TaxID=2893018 RepID=UPI001E65AA11|nr:hypothetical protein [Saccharothrix luteola]MCC8251531.1 hypothetical protein [Saccharothrix luteola]
MSSHRDVVAEVSGYGVAPDLAEELSTSGLLARLHDELAVITEDTDAITGQRRALAVLLKSTGRGVADLLPRLADVARLRFPGVDRMMTVVPARRIVPAPRSGHPHMRYVLATDAVALADPDGDWSVRPAGRTDISDVLPLLVEAMVDGYRVAGTAVGEAQVEADARRLFDRAVEDGIVFVAHDDEGFAGHVTIVPDRDELSGLDRLELFDLFVPRHRRGTPASRLLTSAALRYARNRGLPLRGYVSGHGPAPDRVLDSLLGKGWVRDTTYWSCSLEQEGHRVG